MENMAMGLSTSVIGLCIVGAVLTLLSLLISLFKYISPDAKKDASQVQEDQNADAKKKDEAAAVDDEELVAVITAAVAAMMGTASDGFVVRSIKRTENWNRAARFTKL